VGFGDERRRMIRRTHIGAFAQRFASAAVQRIPSSLRHHVPVVLDVMRKAVCRDRAETRLLQILARLFFAPHGTQTFPALRERHSHAVHARDGVKKSPDRVFDVLVHADAGGTENCAALNLLTSARAIRAEE